MRADVIVLPNDTGNAGKRHAALKNNGEGAALEYTPRMARATDPGVLSGEFTFRSNMASTAAVRWLILFAPMGGGVELLVTCARWKFFVQTAQAAAQWMAYTYSGVPSVDGDLGPTFIASGRGESRQRKALLSLQPTIPVGSVNTGGNVFLRETLTANQTGARDVALIEPGAAGIYLPEGNALALEFRPASAGTFEAQSTLSWQEWVR